MLNPSMYDTFKQELDSIIKNRKERKQQERLNRKMAGKIVDFVHKNRLEAETSEEYKMSRKHYFAE